VESAREIKDARDSRSNLLNSEGFSGSDSSSRSTFVSQSISDLDPHNLANEGRWNTVNENKYSETIGDSSADAHLNQNSMNESSRYNSQLLSSVSAAAGGATDNFIKKTVRKPILKKTFTLKKIGYKVVPYEDETDPRYSFTNENIVFVNKAHSTYKVEAERGDEFLFRHITNIVAEVVVGSKYPEAKDILEIQNKLISEAIKIHDYSMLKK
jgi:hypothetical protein